MSHSLPAAGRLAALVLLLVAGTLFSPALFGGKILAPLDITATLIQPWAAPAAAAKPHNHNTSDAVSQYLPYRQFAEKSLQQDGYIGWNPYEMGGYSMAANTMALPGSWTMQLHRFLSFTAAWNLGIVAEFLIAGFGMLVFLRSRKLGWLPCLVAAVAFMLNAQFIVWIYHRWALGSFCWMPWVLWACTGGEAGKPLGARLMLLPAFLALAMLGSSLQHLVFVGLACGCMAAGSFDFRRPLSNSRSVLRWALAFVLAVGMSAFTLVPQISGYFSNIAIGHVRGRIGYEEGITQPLFHALLIPARLWPWLVGDPQSIDGWRLLKSAFMSLNYIGTIPMLLGFIGLFHPAMPRAAKWLIAVGLLIPLTPLVGPLYHRVELLFILGACWMSAEMLALLAARAAAPRWPRFVIAAVAALGLLLLAGACLPAGIRGPLEERVVAKALAKSSESQFGADQAWIESRAREWTARFSLFHPRTAWVYGLLLAGAGGLLLSTRGQVRTLRAGHLLILGATSLELATLFHTWTTFSDPAELAVSHPAVEKVRSLAGPHRVLQGAEGAGFAATFATPNVLASRFVASIDAYESIQYRSPLQAAAALPADQRLNLAGVGLAIRGPEMRQPGTESWPIVERVGDYALCRNPAVPAPLSAGRGVFPAALGDIATALAAATPLEATHRSANRWAFQVPAGTPWLRIAQNWHPGWRWRVEGGDWQPFRDGADAACWIDTLPAAGAGLEVRFFPRPPWLAFLSLGSLAAWALLLPLGSYGSSQAGKSEPLDSSGAAACS